MDKKFGINLFFYVIFFGTYLLLYDNIKKMIGVEITGGILFLITGIWGLVINELLLKIFFFSKYKKVINIILVTLGTGLIIYGLIKIFIN